MLSVAIACPTSAGEGVVADMLVWEKGVDTETELLHLFALPLSESIFIEGIQSSINLHLRFFVFIFASVWVMRRERLELLCLLFLHSRILK